MFSRLQELLSTVKGKILNRDDLYNAKLSKAGDSLPSTEKQGLKSSTEPPIFSPSPKQISKEPDEPTYKSKGQSKPDKTRYTPNLNHSIKMLDYEAYSFFGDGWFDAQEFNNSIQVQYPELAIKTELVGGDDRGHFMRVSVKNLRVEDYEAVSASIKKSLTELEKKDYYNKGEDDDEKLRRRVHSAIRLLNKGISAEELSRLDGMLREYPKFLLYKLDKNDVGPSIQDERKEKAKKLEEIIAGKNECNDSTEAASKEIVSSNDLSKYKIDFFVPNKDKSSKLKSMAKKVGMCWSNEEAKYLSRQLEEDMRISGGTIMFSITKDERYVAVVRSFIGVDASKKTYLHIDTVEGKCDGVSHHTLTKWSAEQPGALKLAILTNIYLAKLIGVDYLSGGDEPVEEIFSYMRFTKIHTAVNGRNKKIGFQASEEPEEDDVKVKSYFFSSDKNYAMILDPLYKRPSNKNKNSSEAEE